MHLKMNIIMAKRVVCKVTVSCHDRRRGRSEGGGPDSPSIEQENLFRCEFDKLSIAKMHDLKRVKINLSK